MGHARRVALCGVFTNLNLLPSLVEGVLRATSNASSLLFFFASRKLTLEAIVFGSFLHTCNGMEVVPGGKTIAVVA